MEPTIPTKPNSSSLAQTYAPAVVLALAFLWLFHGTIADMADRWKDPTFSHGWIVAPAAIIIAWYKRDLWLKTPVRPSVWGFVIIGFSLLFMIGAAYADINFFPFIAMLTVIGGIIVGFGGWAWFKALIFPYSFLYFMVPWPDVLVSKIAVPMQQMTSIYSSALGALIGLPVVRDGVNLFLVRPDGSHRAEFTVAVACSGMRSLIALLALAAAFAYFTDAPLWKRWGLFLVGIPMALIANIFRVFLILCVGMINPDIAAHLFHDWSAFVLFLLDIFVLMAIRNWILREPKPRKVATASILDTPNLLQKKAEADDAF